MSVFGWDYPAGCSSVPGDDAELPETCPMCGAPNQDEHGEPTYAADPAYCSERCAVADSEAQAIADRLEAEANAEVDALLEAEANAEVDALLEEGAAVVAWLREHALYDRGQSGPELPFIVGARVRYVSPDWGECIGEVLRVEGDRLLVRDDHHVGGIEWWPASRCTYAAYDLPEWVMP